jgi:branched-chain amino acid aminotransferase
MSMVCLNGAYMPAEEAKISALDSAFLYGHGIYETLRTRKGQLLNVDRHLERLHHSAQEVGIPLPADDVLHDWMQATVDKNDFWSEGKESRVRLTIGGGVHGYDDPVVEPTILVTVTPLPELKPVTDDVGVIAITFKIERPLPDLKTTNLLASMQARRAMRAKAAYEVFLVDHRGFITEGSITNVYFIRDGILCTPRAMILSGTTRARILDIASEMDLPVKEDDFSPEDFYQADEIFCTSAIRGVVPVIELDGQRIGDGAVGEKTKILSARLIEGEST